MNINERFEEVIKTLYRGNKRAFAQAIGVSATVVENVVGIHLLVLDLARLGQGKALRGAAMSLLLGHGCVPPSGK